MKPGLRVFVSLPTVLVAVYCLMADAGLGSFLKKVGATYIFFTGLSYALGAMWDASRPASRARSPRSAGPEVGEASRETVSSASNAPAVQTTRETIGSASNAPAVQTTRETAEPAKTETQEIAARP